MPRDFSTGARLNGVDSTSVRDYLSGEYIDAGTRDPLTGDRQNPCGGGSTPGASDQFTDQFRDTF